MSNASIVSQHEWETARQALLVKEKELTHARDALAAERGRMPRVAVEQTLIFEGPDGPRARRPLRRSPSSELIVTVSSPAGLARLRRGAADGDQAPRA